MKLKSWALASALLVLVGPALAQNPITEISGSTYHEKVVFAVNDLRGANLNVATIESAVLDAIKLYARKTRVQQNIPPSPSPAVPSQMTIGQRQHVDQKPECVGEVLSIEGIDSWMAKYGESTYHRACRFPYQDGYRVAATRFSRTSASSPVLRALPMNFNKRTTNSKIWI